MTVSRRELRLRAQEEAARRAAEQTDTERTPPSASPAESRPLTRREMRQMRILQETGDLPAVASDSVEPPVTDSRESAATPPAAATPPPARSSLRGDDRPLRRRRPVLPPQTTSSTPVIDPETGTIGAIEINIPRSASDASAVSGTSASSAHSAAAPSAQSASAPSAHSAPAESAASAPSVSELSAESAPQPPAPPAPEPEPEDVPTLPAPPARAESVPDDDPPRPVTPVSASSAEVPPSSHGSIQVGSGEGASTVATPIVPAQAADDEFDFDSLFDRLDDDQPAREVSDELEPDASDSGEPDGPPKRASLFKKLNDDEPPESTMDEPEEYLTVDQVPIQAKASVGVTLLRYLVLIIAMFVIGGLLWLIADRAAAADIGEDTASIVHEGSEYT